MLATSIDTFYRVHRSVRYSTRLQLREEESKVLMKEEQQKKGVSGLKTLLSSKSWMEFTITDLAAL